MRAGLGRPSPRLAWRRQGAGCRDPVSSMDFDLVIRHGTLVAASDTLEADLGICGGQIVGWGQALHGRQEVDATGLLVLPGAVDPHVHLEMGIQTVAGPTASSDTWATGTVAAACGGTTTVVDFVEPEPGETLAHALAARRAQAEGGAAIDFGLHMTLNRADDDTLAQVPAMFEAGVTSFKTYTTYDGLKLDDAELLRAYRTVGALGGLVLTHAENDAMIQSATRLLRQQGRTDPAAHALARPPEAEVEAVERALALARMARASLYLVHLSTSGAAEALRRARTDGQAAFGETCPQYLLLTADKYQDAGFGGARFVCSPPLRHAHDGAALWQALAAGVIQTIGTDHCPFNYRGQKDLRFGSRSADAPLPAFYEIPGGLPGVETRLALLYTFAVRPGLLSPNRWVQVCCANPARLFGLYPRKGTLAPGADADLVLFDPQREVTLSKAMLHENVDYSPYAGLSLTGYPVVTIIGGRVLVQEGRWLGTAGGGRYLKRGLGGPPL
jgi:dihydropyrimidinase